MNILRLTPKSREQRARLKLFTSARRRTAVTCFITYLMTGLFYSNHRDWNFPQNLATSIIHRIFFTLHIFFWSDFHLFYQIKNNI